MGFKSIGFYKQMVLAAVGGMSSAVGDIYTVPGGKVFVLKELINWSDRTAYGFYIVRNGGVVIPSVGTNTALAARLATVATALNQALTADPSTVLDVRSRNTILNAGDSICIWWHEAGAVTGNFGGFVSGDESNA
jgi:predicted metallopeptidase